MLNEKNIARALAETASALADAIVETDRVRGWWSEASKKIDELTIENTRLNLLLSEKQDASPFDQEDAQ